MRRVLLASLLIIGGQSFAHAQEACPLEMMKDPKLTLTEMWAKAEPKAKAWKADAVPARIINTSMGPIDEAGKSEAWNVMFFSASANASVTIQIFRGMFTCYAQPGPAGRIPDLKPTFFRDSAKIYAAAKANGGAQFLAQGYTLSLGTAAAPSDRHATWNISFEKDSKSAGLLILLDANTGAFEKAIK